MARNEVTWEVANPIPLQGLVLLAQALADDVRICGGLTLSMVDATPEAIAILEKAAADNGLVLVRR